ncbi:maleylpyruvate isomerase family mycothiol-dependent enzyme [Glycomyces xiaoerkulensis]|uniref:maleylpyruvate isomerase family mycothiol-dependent enzyme n=1 Tax=Glycomyces xiaoerkulensis TaxID=2038139 RepID=UPI000C260F21|nr:maleylpyruvate isomerase family mycothiol-dependent enzyme [Glycomyces xiaoerkulensis]
MEPASLRSHLIAEADRLKTAVAGAGPDARVPTCPGWTVADLLEHVTEVYDHKLQCIRLLREPDDSERLKRTGSPTERFEAALAELLTEFDERGPESLAYTWYGPDQTVGFWIRRLACETVVHRADAELAAGGRIGPVDDELGADAVDETLAIKLAWGSRVGRERLAGPLARHGGLRVGIDAHGRTWTVHVATGRIDIEDSLAAGAQATVSGTPGEILMWLWRRSPVGAVAGRGDRDKAAELYDLAGHFTR